MDIFQSTKPQNNFHQAYKCFSGGFVGKENINYGGKILLPGTALKFLTDHTISHPYQFSIRSSKNGKQTHVGVLEFSSIEGHVILPSWLMRSLDLVEEDFVFVTSVQLPQITFLKLQPTLEEFFLKVSDPKVILEKKLREFSCLSQGDFIEILYNDKVYSLLVLETQPAKAVNIIETDCNLDFVPAMDSKNNNETATTKNTDKLNSIQKLNQNLIESESSSESESDSENSDTEDSLKNNKPKFIPFSSSGNRINGKKARNQKEEKRQNNNQKPNTNSKKGNENNKENDKNLFIPFSGQGARLIPKKKKKYSALIKKRPNLKQMGNQKENKPKNEMGSKQNDLSKIIKKIPFFDKGNRIDGKLDDKRDKVDQKIKSVLQNHQTKQQENSNSKKFGRNVKIKKENEKNKKNHFIPFKGSGNSIEKGMSIED
ncbi:ubiquitin fusion degradaton protein [Anaeramoeba flamelloides]|uniref:Ubiquitin fusion degradaton protein n=1 Tax=Anaeramoeba flamelloides TaxID=1746091 RepID=A0AAV7Z785_9EUKA|nr:ubiquitin fusion degradaton protein [Anaeramoeba flamelloides]